MALRLSEDSEFAAPISAMPMNEQLLQAPKKPAAPESKLPWSDVRAFQPKKPTSLEPDYAPAYQAWTSQPGPQTLNVLMRQIQPVLDNAVKQYAPDGGAIATGKAKQLAIEALPSYSPDKGSLSTHLYSRLQRLQRIGAKLRQGITLPEQVAMQNMQLQQVEKELEESLDRPPSEREIADRMKISMKRLAHIRQARPALSTSQLNGGEDVRSLLPDEGEEVWQRYVYDSLSGTDQVIMDHALGLSGKKRLSPGALAQKLGITPGALSQRLEKIQKMLSSRKKYQIV